MAMCDAAHDVLGPADFYERCGDSIVAFEVNLVLRFALQFSTPLWILDRATESWRKVHSAGTWAVRGTPGELTAQLSGFPSTTGYCRLLTAYFQRLLRLTGARELVIEHPQCRPRGDIACVFSGRWRS